MVALFLDAPRSHSNSGSTSSHGRRRTRASTRIMESGEEAVAVNGGSLPSKLVSLVIRRCSLGSTTEGSGGFSFLTTAAPVVLAV